MITETQIRTALWQFFVDNVFHLGNPLTVIQEDQAKFRPDMPYGTIDILNFNALGARDPMTSGANLAGESKVSRFRTVNISFKTIGPGAYDLMQQLVDATNDRVKTNAVWYNDGLSFQVKNAPINATFERDTEIETQYVYDVLVGYAYEGVSNTDYIETTKVQELITEGQQEQIIG